MRLLDISAPLGPGLATWPGDAPFVRSLQASFAAGDPVELSSMACTLHAGTHADAPSHVLEGAPAIDAVDLAPYLGPCQVMRVVLPPGARILPGHLGPVTAPRVLFRTDSFPEDGRFHEGFNGLSPELVAHLAAKGVCLVGLDTPSVDPFHAPLESHRALFRAGMRCLENLRLAHVEPGSYTLCALPLKIEGGDGSPVRAVLMAEG